MILAELDLQTIIFTVTTMAIGVGTAVGAMLSREKKRDGDPFNKDVCKEKHKNIDQMLTSICSHQESIQDKLDRLIERLLK